MSPVGRRGFLAGAAIAGATSTLAAGGAFAASGGMSGPDVLKAGATPDGKADNAKILQGLLDQLGEGEMLTLPPGRYHLSQPLTLSAYRSVLFGFGATLDNTVIFNGRELRALGLTVDGAPREGFRFAHAQGGHFEALSAHENKGPGFLLAGADNQQVAWASFVGCAALHNHGHGWHLDATHQKCWVNANAFLGCWARGNDACGWFSDGHANYNTWTAHEVEGNCKVKTDAAPMMLNGGENFLYGGHVKDTQHKGTAAILGRHSMVFGGRYIGNVEGAEYIQAHVVDSTRLGGGRGRGRAQDDDDDTDDDQ